MKVHTNCRYCSRIQDSPDVTNNQSVINIALALVREFMLCRTIRKWHIGEITRQFPNLNYMFKPRVLRQYNWMSVLSWLMFKGMAVVAWFQTMNWVSVYTLADAQQYGSSCMASGHAFGVCVFAG